MSANAVLPFWRADWMHENILTFVVPSTEGCNLRCPFCIINKRKENEASIKLKPCDYRVFINEIANKKNISLISIQGHEPLLANSFPYTKEILRAGRLLNIKTGLVTNGTHLAAVANELAELEPDTVAVSVDSASSDRHDRLRRVEGSWDSTIENIKHSIDKFTDRTTISVSSILMPGKRIWLDDMPALLKAIGIDRWIINVLIQIGRDSADSSRAHNVHLLKDLSILQRRARSHGIEMAVDDEFARLTDNRETQTLAGSHKLLIRRLEKPSNLFRLLPSGQCSVGVQILDEVASDTPRWVPGSVDAGKFIETLNER